jgi:uncharacterized protein YgiM (DUF1202 family)
MLRRVGHAFVALTLLVVALSAALRPSPVGALSCGPCPASTTDALNLRAEPSLLAEILLVMPAGAELAWDPTQDAINGYVSVTYDGVDGWAYRDYLLLFPVFATTTASLNLRSDPNLDAEVLLVMPEGAQVMMLSGPENGYFSVRFDDRVIGWAHGDYLVLGSQGENDGVFPTGMLIAVDTDWLNLREAPSLNGDVIDVLPFGVEGTVLEPPTSMDGYIWQRIDFGSAYGAGWVASGVLTFVAASGDFAIGDEVVVVDGPLNYRTDPTPAAGVIDVLAEGTDGAILDGPVYADGWTWYQLGLPGYGPDGETPGWVAGEFLGRA